MDSFENETIDLTNLPQLGDQYFETLPLRYFKLRLYTWAMFVALKLLFLISGLVWLVLTEDLSVIDVPTPLWVFLGVSFTFLGFWGVSEYRGFELRGYVLRERDLSYRAGYFFHSYTTLPFNRLQHSEISQGPNARAFKICTLKLYTAGSSGANLSISGMDPLDAQRIRDYIDEYAED
jgi:hypothetical protein